MKLKTDVYAVMHVDKYGKEALVPKYASNPYYLRQGDATKAAANNQRKYGYAGSLYFVVKSKLDWEKVE